jgi:hypothetical protein
MTPKDSEYFLSESIIFWLSVLTMTSATMLYILSYLLPFIPYDISALAKFLTVMLYLDIK